MRRTTLSTAPVLLVFLLAALPGAAAGQPLQISGTITTTMTIGQDAELTGDVTCQVAGTACLDIRAPDVTLRLNGFTITGRAEPPAGCVSSADFGVLVEDGIRVVGENNVTVLGPGRVEKFGRFGVFAMSGSGVTIRWISASDNCFSGIQVWTMTDSDVIENVAARNSMGSEGFPCGGI